MTRASRYPRSELAHLSFHSRSTVVLNSALRAAALLLRLSVGTGLPSCPGSLRQSSDHRLHAPAMPHDSTDPTPPSKSISDNEIE